jgi:hypothetical protein
MSETSFDGEVRIAIASFIRGRGRVPTIADVAASLARPASDVESSFARMAEAHVFVPRHGSKEIHSYNPFCAEQTDFRVRSGGREWWAMCGWDALGIPAALGESGTVESTCADCRADLRIEVDGRSLRAPDGVVLLVGVPAREFWKDIYFT